MYLRTYVSQVAWKCLYSKSSGDHGTVAFFRNRLGRIAVSKEPKKDVNATIDLLEVVVKGHWIACACDVLGIASMDAEFTLPVGLDKARPKDQLCYIQGIAQKVVDRLTLVDSAFERKDATTTDDSIDKVYNYTRTLCHFGALMIEFRDAWGEGDGDRVLRCWRLFLPHFRAYGRTKYSLEALRVQIQTNVVLSPNLAHQVKWHRFVNTKGGLGMNIPCDLYNEHINKAIKRIIQNMGSNLTESALQRAVRCVAPLQQISKQFDRESGVPTISSAHKTKSDEPDMCKIVKVVLSGKLLVQQATPRKHKAFPDTPPNPLHCWDQNKTEEWIKTKKKEYMKYKGGFRREEDGDEDEEQSL